MLFKFLEKPIEITAFVSSDYAFANTYSPIKASSHFIPDWWKNISKKIGNWKDDEYVYQTSVKGCLGIIGTFQTGYILPMWSDLAIKIHEDGAWRYQFSDRKSSIQCHRNSQTPNFYEDTLILKIQSPWLLQTSEDLKLIYCDPFYTLNEKNYHIPYGVCPTINKMSATNIFLFFKNQSNEILIKNNTPMLHLIPLTERKIKFKTEVLSKEEADVKRNILAEPITFNSKGLNMLKILRKQKNG